MGAERVRIATFNLESLDEKPDHGVDLPARVAALRPLLLRLDADILCLQEVNARAHAGRPQRDLGALDRLIEETPYAAFERVTMTSTGGIQPADRHNLVILSRWPVRESRQVRHAIVKPLAYQAITASGAEPGIEASFDRPLLHAEIVLPGAGPLHVVNLHFKAPLASPIPGQKRSAFQWKSAGGWAEGFFVAALKRNSQALEARLLLERLFDADEGALIAVCGDFNAGLEEMPVRILVASPEDTGNPALASRALGAVEEGVAPERRFTVRHAGRGVMLDHILASQRLRAALTGVEVHNEGLSDEVNDAERGTAGSFHAPLAATFALDLGQGRAGGPSVTSL